mmetsp:Transcript_6266/g.10639  ORF Transcript_6266/g.10639 Transcript_6266/m.10639 type:complete len:190 (+) Transcript_6266:562-1131(+)
MPELITPHKKFSQMEMEMDKFLAKKSQIFNKAVLQVTHFKPNTQGKPQAYQQRNSHSLWSKFQEASSEPEAKRGPGSLSSFLLGQQGGQKGKGEGLVNLELSFHIYQSIVHQMIKTLYELLRNGNLRISSLKSVNQVQADLFYLYSTSVYLVFYLVSCLLMIQSQHPQAESAGSKQGDLPLNSLSTKQG